MTNPNETPKINMEDSKAIASLIILPVDAGSVNFNPFRLMGVG